ncbi:Ribosome biogenesis protein BOP1 [Trichuris trichiura]|uniref:Ribosome biogenesis protein BOP1 n=1 Tax=Trichuris trichiura TaxID=36087 RepID=A0A077YVZ3_TRITR|nr:Ribosome biogenesis protein BOP1 [Trichuris trichiura]
METQKQKSVISFLFELCNRNKLTVSFEQIHQELRPNNEILFFVRVSAGDFLGSGFGKNLKVAKARASLQLLQKVIHGDAFKSWGIPGDTKEEALKFLGTLSCGTEKDAAPQTTGGDGRVAKRTPIAVLNELCMKRGYSPPHYEDVFQNIMRNDDPSANNQRAFFVKAVLGPFARIGTGPTKKAAKQAAAEALLQALSNFCDQDLGAIFREDEELGPREDDVSGENTEGSPTSLFVSGENGLTLQGLKDLDLDNLPAESSCAQLLEQVLPMETAPFAFYHLRTGDGVVAELALFDRKEVYFGRGETLVKAMDDAALKFLRVLKEHVIANSEQ